MDALPTTRQPIMSALPDYAQLASEISANLSPLRKGQPAVMKAFNELGRAALATGALEEKTKELMALAIGIAVRCDGCIAFHMRTLVKLGVSRAEVEETLALSVYMGGGPSLMYAANAMAAYEQFSGAAAQPGQS
jgi:AhpD family alkylhydroperoxidase